MDGPGEPVVLWQPPSLIYIPPLNYLTPKNCICLQTWIIPPIQKCIPLHFYKLAPLDYTRYFDTDQPSTTQHSNKIWGEKIQFDGTSLTHKCPWAWLVISLLKLTSLARKIQTSSTFRCRWLFTAWSKTTYDNKPWGEGPHLGAPLCNEYTWL